MTIIKDQKYSVEYIEENNIVNMTGYIALGSPLLYTPIMNLLKHSAEKATDVLTLDIKNLTFLNSSGINMLAKFVTGFRSKKSIQLVILGSIGMAWQTKTLKNLEKLLPGIKLVIE